MKVFTVIPTHKATVELLKTVQRVRNPIVVFDGFYDSIFADKLKESNSSTVILNSPGGNAYKARNTGVTFALENGSEYILFTDSDCVTSVTWEREMVKDGGEILLGWTHEIPTKSKMLQLYGERQPYGLGTNPIKFFCSGTNIFPTCNVGYKIDVFKKIGYFPEVSGGDMLFSDMAVKAGFTVSLRHAATIKHYLCTDLFDLFKKRIRYGGTVVNGFVFGVFLFALVEQVGFLGRMLAYQKFTKENIKYSLFHFVAELAVHYGFAIGRVKNFFIKNKVVI